MTAFFDTNILIYGLVSGLGDGRDTVKHQIAARLIDEYVESGDLWISTQVMSEFFVVATRKGAKPLSPTAAALVLEQMSLFPVIAVDKELVLRATVRMMRNRLSYWDGLIVEAALRAGATVLYSEDMQHGSRFDGIEVRNPFATIG